MKNFDDKKKQIEELTKKDIQCVLNKAAEIIGNPIALFDITYRFIACTENVTTDDILWNELTGSGKFSHKTVDLFFSEGFINSYAESETCILLRNDKLQYERFCGTIFDEHGFQTGDIVVIACFKPFEPGDSLLVDALCDVISQSWIVEKFGKSEKALLEGSIVNTLIETDIIDKKLIKEVARIYDSLKSNLYIAVIDISQYDKTITHLEYFCDLFSRIQGEYRYCVYFNYIVVIISIDGKFISTEKDLKALSEFFTKNRIYAGVSSKFFELTKMKAYYNEAINALNYGQKSKREQNIFYFDNYRLDYFLSHNETELDILVNPLVYQIREYDLSIGGKPSLIDVLNTYLLYGTDAKAACAVLKTEEDLLAAKIKLLESEFGIDWQNGEMLSGMLFSLKYFDRND